MSDDLIRRSDAIKIVRERLDSPHMQNIWQQGACLSILRAVENTPTIEPKRGEWIEINKEVISIPIKWGEADKREPIYKAKLRCSVCGFQKSFIDGHTAQYNFCPNCGADMRKETVDYKHVVLTCDDEGNWSMHGE